MPKIIILLFALLFIDPVNAGLIDKDWPYEYARQGRVEALKEVAHRANNWKDEDAQSVLNHFIDMSAEDYWSAAKALGLFSDSGNIEALATLAHLAADGNDHATAAIQRFINKSTELDPDGYYPLEIRIMTCSSNEHAKTVLKRFINKMEKDQLNDLKVEMVMAVLGDADALQEIQALCEKEDLHAQMAATFIYANGYGVKQDDEAALHWVRKAAEKGAAAAQVALGDMYGLGRGVAKDLPQAAVWYRKAAEQGYRHGQYMLGVAFFGGFVEGIEKDSAEAVKWFRKAAEQGHSSAAFALTDIHYTGWPGNGIRPASILSLDAPKAYAWNELAVISQPEFYWSEEDNRAKKRFFWGHHELRKPIDVMSEQQIVEGEKLAGEFHELIYGKPLPDIKWRWRNRRYPPPRHGIPLPESLIP